MKKLLYNKHLAAAKISSSKKIMLFFITLYSFSLLNAQITYHNYLDCSSEWRYYVGGSTIGGPFKGYFTLYFDGDTIINGDAYYRQKGIFRNQGSSTVKQYPTNFIREDSFQNFIGSCNYGTLWFSSSKIDTLYKFSQNNTLQLFDSLPNLTKPQINFKPYVYYCPILRFDTFYLGSKKLSAYSPISSSYLSTLKIYPDIVEGIGATYPDFCNNGCCDKPILYLYHYTKNFDTLSFNSTPFKYSFDSFPTPIHTFTCAILPLKIISFNIQEKTNSISQTWTTANEINVSHFNIQRSINGKDFYTIRKVPAKNNSYNEYNFIDNQPLFGDGYYKIQSIDKDGKANYTETKKIARNNKQETINVYPNPTTTNINITSQQYMQQIKIINQMGQTLQQLNNINTKQKAIDVKQFSKGIYIIQITTTNQEIKTQKIIIE